MFGCCKNEAGLALIRIKLTMSALWLLEAPWPRLAVTELPIGFSPDPPAPLLAPSPLELVRICNNACSAEYSVSAGLSLILGEVLLWIELIQWLPICLQTARDTGEEENSLNLSFLSTASIMIAKSSVQNYTVNKANQLECSNIPRI
jgi:hypothetical protein